MYDLSRRTSLGVVSGCSESWEVPTLDWGWAEQTAADVLGLGVRSMTLTMIRKGSTVARSQLAWSAAGCTWEIQSKAPCIFCKPLALKTQDIRLVHGPRAAATGSRPSKVDQWPVTSDVTDVCSRKHSTAPRFSHQTSQQASKPATSPGITSRPQLACDALCPTTVHGPALQSYASPPIRSSSSSSV